jgi:hypothetical protein
MYFEVYTGPFTEGIGDREALFLVNDLHNLGAAGVEFEVFFPNLLHFPVEAQHLKGRDLIAQQQELSRPLPQDVVGHVVAHHEPL